jgi:Raf kinase inhibitor-like YbhB/YbcL family protein
MGQTSNINYTLRDPSAIPVPANEQARISGAFDLNCRFMPRDVNLFAPGGAMQTVSFQTNCKKPENHSSNRHFVDHRVEPINQKRLAVGGFALDADFAPRDYSQRIGEHSGKRQCCLLKGLGLRPSDSADSNVGAMGEMLPMRLRVHVHTDARAFFRPTAYELLAADVQHLNDGMSFQLTVDGFADGAKIPSRFTCDGEDLSPALRWTGEPPETKSFALIMDDPDAPGGTFNHWLVWDIPAYVHSLAETDEHASLAKSGTNDFRKRGYGGPCPPQGGGLHRYVFGCSRSTRQGLACPRELIDRRWIERSANMR